MTVIYLNKLSQYCCENGIKPAPAWREPLTREEEALIRHFSKPPTKTFKQMATEMNLDYPILRDPSDLYPKIP